MGGPCSYKIAYSGASLPAGDSDDLGLDRELLSMVLSGRQANRSDGAGRIGLDYGGFGVEVIPAADVERILGAFPRLKMKQQFADACCRLVKAKPETSYDNFLRDFGE